MPWLRSRAASRCCCSRKASSRRRTISPSASWSPRRGGTTRLSNPEESAGAEVVAEETGGFALHNPNDLEAGLTRIARETSSYYLLGYSPTNPKRDGKYRRLQVEVRRTGLEVRARRGYYAPAPEASRRRPGAKPGADPDLERALASAVLEREIPVRLGAFSLQPV